MASPERRERIMTQTVALIGVGAMGSALLERLRLAQKQVRAYDIAALARTAAADAGAEIFASPAEAARSATMIHVFVRTDDEVLEAVCGKDGALAGAEPGAVLMLHSTILPGTTRLVADAAVEKHVRVLDVPITSVPARVRKGQAAFLVGGPNELVAEVRSYLETIGGVVYHFGPLGSGNVAKLAKNAMNAVERVMFAEMLRMAVTAGLDARRFLDMLRAEHHGSAVSDWEKVVTLKDSGPVMRPVTNLLNKDLPLAAEYARTINLDLPVTRQAAAEGQILIEAWTRSWKHN